MQELDLQFKQIEPERLKSVEETKQREAELELARLSKEEETKQLLIRQQMAEAQIRLEDRKLEAAAAANSRDSKGPLGSFSIIGLHFPKDLELL